MKITLNAIEFDVTPVAGPLRRAILLDEAIRPGLLRDVATWRRDPGETKTYGPVTKEGGVVLPNGILFFVTKTAENGAIEKSEGPSKKMAERFLEALGNKTLQDLQQAVHGLFGVLTQKMPLEVFAPLNILADWNLRMGTDFAVLQLQNAARNLTAYVLMPAQVGFGAAIVEKGEGFEAFAEAPEGALLKRQPGYIVRPQTQAAILARRIALNQRVQELATALEGKTVLDLPLDDLRRIESERLAAEWGLLFPKVQARSA